MYYEISVPIKLKTNLTYTSTTALQPGIRVIVSVGNNLFTGIVIKQIPDDQINIKIRYKRIMEIVDHSPVLSPHLLKLAQWMSEYYWTSPGIVIDTMLPLALKHHITQRVKLANVIFHSSGGVSPLGDGVVVGGGFSPPEFESEQSILSILSTTQDWVDIATLRSQIKDLHFYHSLESLEQKQLIEIYRTFDEKIKPKFANFIKILPPPNDVKLTPVQQKAYELVVSVSSDGDRSDGDRSDGDCDHVSQRLQGFLDADHPVCFADTPPNEGNYIPTPLSKLSKDISYAVIKALQAKKLIEVYPAKVDTDIFQFPERQTREHITLNPEQSKALKAITENIDTATYHTFLLYGVTGSGKTEVYINAVLHAQTLGKSALMLVPEIALTPQMVHRFYHVFGRDIAVLHSSLTDRERYLQWQKIHKEQIKIVIGTRSAVFAPLHNIGVIIVDEEHDSSYKQEHQPCYQARDVAVMRGSMECATVILGSATPSLESWDNVLKKKYSLLKLSIRPQGATLPEVQIVDMRSEDSDSFFSDTLKAKIADRLSKKEQIILFHNRRAYANFMQCVHCRLVFKCPDCDISLCYHKADNRLVCHYCGYAIETPRKCTSCGGYHFVYGAPGTQQIEAQLRVLFPSAKILRIDSDTTKKKYAFIEMFDSMKSGHIDILLGTQMISKGLDFHNVTLVGVIMADISLNIPDFRATERTFQQLTQVAGRSGRGQKKGEVVIQTYKPDHYAIVYALQQDFLSYSHNEIIMRREAHYPPHFKLCRVLFTCADLALLKQTLSAHHTLLMSIALQFPEEEFMLLSFIEAPMPRIKNKYRYHFIIKSAKMAYIQKFLWLFIEGFQCPASVQMMIDVDPMGLL